MRLNVVSMGLYQLSFEQTLVLATAVAATANGNINFPDLIGPTILELNAMITDFSDALTAWGPPGNRGSHLQYLTVVSTCNTLRTGLTGMALCAENVAQGDRDMLATIEWPLRQVNVPTGVLGAIRNLRQLNQPNVLQGTLKLRWNKPLDTVNIKINGYRVMRGVTADFNAAEQVGIVTKTSFIDENPGTGYRFYWIIPFNAYGNGVTSGVCAAIAVPTA